MELANLIIRGGWPGNIHVKNEQARIIPANYINSILDKDMNDDKKEIEIKCLCF